ncbi:hypothetical protein PIB30_041344 [Stylosanthes scabra]|uniref:Uncharacterized protein n=1 Tax=Stylosanthes scabra TaxID=79078 RepID=A0ABU6XCL0_9FABA|nr:hypothetical protein [Stylosanthes scabra]
MNLSDFVVVTLYPNGEMGRDSGGIWFRSATPMVFQMQPVNTLKELKAVILRNMEVAGGTMLVKRVAYTLKICVGCLICTAVGGATAVIPCSPIHFTAPEAPMQSELDDGEDSDEDFVRDTEESSESSDGAEFVSESQCRRDFLLIAPAPIPDLSSVSSHFQTLYLDDMGEQPREGFGGGGEDYDVDMRIHTKYIYLHDYKRKLKAKF